MGALLGQRGDLDGADRVFREALRRDPNHAGAARMNLTMNEQLRAMLRAGKSPQEIREHLTALRDSGALPSSAESTREAGEHTCAHCGKATTGHARCSRCKVAWYCGRECQRSHWRAGHREACELVSRRGEG